MSGPAKVAKRYIVRGRVQGVGFRYFVERAANSLQLRGHVRNLDDGTVEVYAIGPPERLSELAGLLWKGPRFAEVRGVDEQDASVQNCDGFSSR
jgi:acylphosphatase